MISINHMAAAARRDGRTPRRGVLSATRGRCRSCVLLNGDGSTHASEQRHRVDICNVDIRLKIELGIQRWCNKFIVWIMLSMVRKG